ncbi:MAG: mechanosensitive ion channel [Pirellulales bacterium]
MAQLRNLLLLLCASVGLSGFSSSTCLAQEDFLRQLNPNLGSNSTSKLGSDSDQPLHSEATLGEFSEPPSRLGGARQLPPLPAWRDQSSGQLPAEQTDRPRLESLPPISSNSVVLASGLPEASPLSPGMPSSGFSNSGLPYSNPAIGANPAVGQFPADPLDRNSLEPGAFFLSTYSPARIDAARQSAAQYRSQSTFSVPKVAELANTNADLVEQWVELAKAVNSVSSQVANAQNRFQSAKHDYQDITVKLQQNGTSSTIGQLLSHKRKQLEDLRVVGSSVHYVNDDVLQSRQKQLESNLMGFDGRDVGRQSSQIIAGLRLDPNNAEDARVSSQIQNMLHERSQWLKQLKQSYNDYRDKLGDLAAVSASLNSLIGEYQSLINRHVIWIANNDPLAVADFQKLQPGLSSVFSSGRSLETGFALRQKWKSDSANGLLLIVSVLSILVLRSFAKAWLVGIGKRTKMRESTASSRKCVASLLTLLVAIAVPSVLYLIARWLGSGYVAEATLHLSYAFYAASLIALVVELPRQLLRRFGFVEKQLHIDLPRQQRAAMFLLVIGLGLVLSAYLVTLSGQVDQGIWSSSVARIGFLLSMLLVAWTAHLAFKPKRGFLEPVIEKFGGAVFYRIRVLFYVLGVGFSVAMIALSSLGYDFTANEIIKRAAIMLAAVLVGTTLWAAVKILASKAWYQLTGNRDERQLDEYAEPGPQVSGALAAHSLELKHQLAFLSQCALVLVSLASVGWLWIDIFPNVRLGNPVLWTVEGTSTQAFLDVTGQSLNRSSTTQTPITLLHVVIAGATLFIAFQIAKLLPSIFDALILQRVNFDEAMEHLTLMLGRCVLFGIGCVIAFRMVGLRWEVIQWLAVGLSIGIGFGMQDVVKNLLGGLIVFFEKPARLGDLITVGSVTGRVAAQKLRTTTLSDEDGREVIVPNKHFMSQEVVNWLGSGRLSAIPIEVTVTRDERPADVCRMLQHLMVAQPELLLSPAPQATLICVAQQSQRIGLLAWVEEDQDAGRYRETLLKIVREFLDEKNLLAVQQPRQPSIEGNSYHRLPKSRKRRSA